MLRSATWVALVAALAVAGAGCSARSPLSAPQTAARAAAAVPTDAPVASAPQDSTKQPTAAAAANPAQGSSPATDAVVPAANAAAEAPAKPSLRELCRFETDSSATVDEARRRLQETFCSATLWFDGLFGAKPDVANARRISGRVELSGLYSKSEGTDLKARLRLRYELPNLNRRVNIFLGRTDERELIEDRYEGLPIRSAFFGLADQDEWLGGLGYAPPGRWAERLDIRVGVRLSTASELFTQARYRRNFFLGERSVLRLRETLFYTNRADGFGGTSSVDVDHLLGPSRLLRFGAVATLSQDTEGTRWRTALMLFQNLERRRAILYQAFVRGETANEVPIQEYGAQGVLRLPLGRTWLFANLTGGYTWPRKQREDPRDGSFLVGFGVELHFGEDPL